FTARSPEDYKQSITVGSCKKHPCRLRKGRVVDVEFRFTPEEDVKGLSNSVSALLGSLPFPFIGVDGTDACVNIFAADGTTKAGCPLKAGTSYVYKNHFEILPIYPLIRIVVHWGLVTSDGKDVMCFEVPAKITAS
ncbi:NPC intracellular cholesterol transporter 2-like, partial [Photinus pyralis]|uniref:NPC intracellular cholesterol transporter 2-like n=1 Tax=Photinus pyralis TaxID=7054 RepID=UPI001266FD38